MRETFTQGTIISNMRSVRYPGIKCKGIVASARCDLAQSKINYFHCLSAMTIYEWINVVLVKLIISECQQNVLKKIEKLCDDFDFDYLTVLDFGPHKTKELFEKQPCDGKQQKGILKHFDEWLLLQEYEDLEFDKAKLKEFLNEKMNIFNNKMNELNTGKLSKYCYIPQKAYSNSIDYFEGIVVDLQDIYQIPINVKEMICDSKMDYILLKNKPKILKELNRYFFLECNDDFVIDEGTISSPWIEKIVQGFSQSFSRIGLDNATKEEVKEFCKQFTERI